MKRFSWVVLGCVAAGGLVWGISTSIAQLPERDGPSQSGSQSGPRREGPDDRRPGRPPQDGGRGGEGFSGDPERRGPGGPGGPEGGPMGGGPMMGGPGMFGPQPTRFLIVLDLNRDFQISAEEIAKAPESLRRLDIDQDGVISEDEFNMPPPRPPRNGMNGGSPGEGSRGERPRGEGPPRDGGPRDGGPQGDGPEGRRPPPPRDDSGPDESRRGPPRNEPGREGQRGGPEGRPRPEGSSPGAALEKSGEKSGEQSKDTVAIAPSELPKEVVK